MLAELASPHQAARVLARHAHKPHGDPQSAWCGSITKSAQDCREHHEGGQPDTYGGAQTDARSGVQTGVQSNVSVPTGMTDELPVDVQLLGRRVDEASLFDAGEVIESRAGILTPIDPVGPRTSQLASPT